MKTEEIVKRIQKEQDTALFNELLNSYEKMIYKVINSFNLNNGAFLIDEDELFQEGSLALYNAAMAYDERKGAKFTTFAYKVIYNNIVNKIREAKRRSGRDQYSIDTFNYSDYSRQFSVAERYVSYGQESELLRDYELFCKTLSVVDRNILLLRQAGLSYKQIGEKLGISSKKVDNRLVYIKRRMKAFLKLE